MNVSLVRALRSVVALASLVATAACSGGASSPTALAPASPGAAVPVASPASAARTSVRVVLPPHGATTSSFRRRPAFVSPATAGADVAVYTSPQSANPTPVAELALDLTTASTICSADPGGTRTCVAALPITTGTYDFVFTLYDGAPTGNAFGGAHVLGGGRTTKTIVRGADNVVGAAIEANVASLALAPGRQVFPAARAGTLQIGVTPLDVDADTILAGTADPYANPVTLSVAETGGHTRLVLDGGTPATSVVSTNLADRITAVYDGAGGIGYTATVSAQAAGVASVAETLDTFAISTRRMDFGVYGTSQTLDVTEPHATGPFTLQPVLCDGVATASAGARQNGTQRFTITAGSSNGTCNFLPFNEFGQLSDRDFVDLFVPGPAPTSALYIAGGGGIGHYTLPNGTFAGQIGPDVYTNMTTYLEGTGVARDAAGEILATDVLSDSVLVFAATANDNMAPIRTIAGSSTRLSAPSRIRVDPAGESVVLNGNATITVYAPGVSGNVAPVRTIALGGLPPTAYQALAVDGSGDVFVVGSTTPQPDVETDYLYEFAPGANGAAMPIRTISGSGEIGILGPGGMTVDANGDVYVTSQRFDDFAEFGPTQSGDATPIFQSSRELNQPSGIVVEPDGTILTTGLTPNGEDVVTYPPGALHATAEFATSFDSPKSDLSL